jgi:dienelactone hydrolase
MVSMASVALFHSLYGLRPAVLTAAARLRVAGHTVVTPDLYRAAPAESLAEGILLAGKVGFAQMLEHARDAVRKLPDDAVLAGLSMGTGIVDALLPERPATAGVLLLSGAAVTPQHLREGLRAQLHVADPDDEFVPPAEVNGWVDAMTGAGAAFEVYRYPGVGHLWTDAGTGDFDGPAADLAWERCAEFLRLS